MSSFTLHQGTQPLLVSVPHAGTQIPDELKKLFTDRALAVEDTDWFLDTIYAFAKQLGASFIVPKYSRYVVDLNRPPENTPMYTGVNNTELCPTRFFSGDPLYKPGLEPNDSQIESRVKLYWQPYHEALQAELARIKTIHGHAVLWDGHSICSQLPWLFDGRLPNLNLGTVSGTSCAIELQERVHSKAMNQTDFNVVLNGRFKGGYITRQYGQPVYGIHAIQLEMTWNCYMVEQPPYSIDPARCDRLVAVLEALLQTAMGWKPSA
jgi:N-formylglutamate deformylase